MIFRPADENPELSYNHVGAVDVLTAPARMALPSVAAAGSAWLKASAAPPAATPAATVAARLSAVRRSVSTSTSGAGAAASACELVGAAGAAAAGPFGPQFVDLGPKSLDLGQQGFEGGLDRVVHNVFLSKQQSGSDVVAVASDISAA